MSIHRRIFIDSFSGQAADLKGAQRTPENVYYALSLDPRVSTWDLSEHPWLQNCIRQLVAAGAIVAVDTPYPWHSYKLVSEFKL